MITENAKPEDAQSLADIRAEAMRESLEAVDRYDFVRVKERFLSGFLPELTHKILVDGQVAGFYMVTESTMPVPKAVAESWRPWPRTIHG